MARPKLTKPKFKLRKEPRSGIWKIYWTEGSKTVPHSCGTRSENEAADYFTRFIKQYEEASSYSLSPTVGEIVTGYRNDRKRHVRGVGTLENSCRHIERLLGHIIHDDLSRSDIEWFAEKRTEEGVSGSTIIRDLGILRASLNWAEREKLISRSFQFRMPVKPSPPRERWITREEAKKLFIECKKGGIHVYTFALIALQTGARRQAILDLQWDAVDFKKRLIDFSAVQGGEKKRRAVVPMTKELYEHLKMIFDYSISEYVVEYSGNKVSHMYKAFKHAVDRAGLENVSPHIMRHTAATWMMMRGVPTREIARYLEMTEEMVESVYGKHSPHYLKRASKAMELNIKARKAA